MNSLVDDEAKYEKSQFAVQNQHSKGLEHLRGEKLDARSRLEWKKMVGMDSKQKQYPHIL